MPQTRSKYRLYRESVSVRAQLKTLCVTEKQTVMFWFTAVQVSGIVSKKTTEEQTGTVPTPRLPAPQWQFRILRAVCVTMALNLENLI